jgi:hypothetical protein
LARRATVNPEAEPATEAATKGVARANTSIITRRTTGITASMESTGIMDMEAIAAEAAAPIAARMALRWVSRLLI